jgi:hypothetical protein
VKFKRGRSVSWRAPARTWKRYYIFPFEKREGREWVIKLCGLRRLAMYYQMVTLKQ